MIDNIEQFNHAFNKRQPHPHSSTVREQTVSTSDLRWSLALAKKNSHSATRSDAGATEDLHITFAENACVTQCNAQQPADKSRLIWNSEFTRILASPDVDPSAASEIKAQAGHASGHEAQGDEEVDMRAVTMVPNLSCPVANAHWCDACHASDWPCLDGSECYNSAE